MPKQTETATPGPWQVGKTDAPHEIYAEDMLGRFYGKNREANAQLASTAPELLDAVEMAARVFRTYEMLHKEKAPPDEAKATRNAQYAEFCEAAAKKAKGDA